VFVSEPRNWLLKEPSCLTSRPSGLAPEAVQGPASSELHHVHGGHRLPLGVLGVRDGVPDHVLQDDREHPAGLLVDQTGDPLRSAADVITENLPVALGASFLLLLFKCLGGWHPVTGAFPPPPEVECGPETLSPYKTKQTNQTQQNTHKTKSIKQTKQKGDSKMSVI